ncbi:MAG: YggS family pyridoxal phosphate-dependent enzyme [Spirochaetaceae bacterium]|nr:YggS family pyridoxal phosphate-dependent enzyme [Spirochaetaceae bacterium]
MSGTPGNEQPYASVAGAVERVRERIAAAASRAGREAQSVEIMAVTKLHPIDAAEAAHAMGIRVFGESRVQEAEAKYASFLDSRPDTRLEMIGHLQSNKVKKAVSLFSCIQSVDSLDILSELDRRACADGMTIEVLFELHTGEESKAGFPDLDALFRACDSLAAKKALVLRGLMTMAPFTDEGAPVRRSFKALAAAYKTIRERYGFPRFEVVSMGMSNDFEIAVEEGSTMLRLGTILFGSRGR